MKLKKINFIKFHFMKNLFSISLIILFTLNLLTFSCQKEGTEAVLNTVQFGIERVPVIDGRLNFRDFDQLQLVYDYISKTNQPYLSDETIFVSAYSAFLKTNRLNESRPFNEWNLDEKVSYLRTDADGEKTISSIISHPIYSKLLNQERSLQVGKQILVFDLDKYHVFDAKFANLISEPSKIKDKKTFNFPTKVKIEKCESLATCRNVYALRNGKQWKKIEAEIKPEYIMVGPSIYLLTGRFIYESKSYKRGFLGGWSLKEADELSITLDNGTPMTELDVKTMARIGNACISDHGIKDTNEDNGTIQEGGCSM